MPIVNGAYVAPTWNNDAPPAINAAELQDICKTIEKYNTTKADVSYVNTFVRPNLLDNAYFVGGGSQQGGGQFPINQRGSAVYSPGAGQYTIGRWYFRIAAGCSLTLEANDLMLTSGGYGFQGIIQSVENGVANLAGKTVTLSVLVTQNNLSSAQLTLSNGSSSSTVGTEISHTAVAGTGLFSFTATVPPSLSNNYLNVTLSFGNDAANKTIKITAMKLEVGDTQTLAHWDEATQSWVLNEVPNFEVELAKCQRTVVPLGNFERIRASRVVGSVINFFVPTPVSMRGAGTMTLIPSLSDPNNIIKIYDMNNNQLTGFTFSAAACSSNGVTIAASKTNHGITDAYIQFESNTYNAFLVNDL